MTTRRPIRRDRVEQRVVDRVEVDGFCVDLEHAGQGLFEGDPPSAEEISMWVAEMAHSDLVSPAQMREFLKRLARQLGDIWPTEVSYRELARKLVKIEIGARAKGDQAELSWCDSHGWTHLIGLSSCAGCPCELPSEFVIGLQTAIGRPRRYCSNACRQRAYRVRRRARDTTDGDAG